MEFSGDLLTRVSYVFFNLAGADTNDALQAISKQISPKLSSSQDDIFLNPMLFQRVKTLHEQRNSLSLNTAQAKLLEDTYKSFTRGGANLSAEDKITLRGLNEQISKLAFNSSLTTKKTFPVYHKMWWTLQLVKLQNWVIQVNGFLLLIAHQ